MKREEIFEKVKQIIEEKVDIPERFRLTEQLRLKEDLGADSLDGVEILIELDKQFSIDTDIYDTERINNGTLSDIVDLVEEYLEKKKQKKK